MSRKRVYGGARQHADAGDEYHTTWIRLDTGLLDDWDFMTLTMEQQWLWLRLYLALARMGGFAPDHSRLEWLANKVAADSECDAGAVLSDLGAAGMVVEVEGWGWTVKGFVEYQRPKGRKTDPTGRDRKRAQRAREADAEQEDRAKEAGLRGRGDPTSFGEIAEAMGWSKTQ